MSDKLVVWPKRNDTQVNDHNPLMSTFWGANTDLQVIVDPKACLQYCLKYTTKGETLGEAAKSIISDLTPQDWNPPDLGEVGDNRKMLRKLMIRAAGKRDWSKAEAAGLLMKTPLVHCSHDFVSVMLRGSRWINTDPEQVDHDNENTDVEKKSLLDHYAERFSDQPGAVDDLDISLNDFVLNYSIYTRGQFKGQLKKREKRCVPVFYPRYRNNKKDTTYWRYCWSSLLIYKPWSRHRNDCWGGGPDVTEPTEAQQETIVRAWDAFKKQKTHDFAEIDDAEADMDDNMSQVEDSQMPQLSDIQPEQFQEEFQAACRVVNMARARHGAKSKIEPPPFTDEVPERRLEYSDLQLQKAHNWLSDMRAATEGKFDKQPPYVGPDQLNSKQLQVYDMVDTYLRHKKQLLLQLLGTAGTGKSWTISSLYHLIRRKQLTRKLRRVAPDDTDYQSMDTQQMTNLLQELGANIPTPNGCFLAATTGKASHLIKGRTIHSLLALPVGKRNNGPLGRDSRKRLQAIWKRVKLLVIDETSMLGCRDLFWIDSRLREIFSEKAHVSSVELIFSIFRNSFDEALSYVKNKRNLVNLNINFANELRNIENINE